MTPIRRQTVFASLDQPPAWPATPRRPRPARLDAALDTLPGVGPTVMRKLAKLGLGTVRDLLEHRPFRYEAAVPEVPIAALRRDEEGAIAGEVRVREQLPLKSDALAVVHHPASVDEAEVGRKRLAFEELLLLQVGIARRAAERERTLAPSLGEPGELIARYRKALPFALTPY